MHINHGMHDTRTIHSLNKATCAYGQDLVIPIMILELVSFLIVVFLMLIIWAVLAMMIMMIIWLVLAMMMIMMIIILANNSRDRSKVLIMIKLVIMVTVIFLTTTLEYLSSSSSKWCQ